MVVFVFVVGDVVLLLTGVTAVPSPTCQTL
jgi:hypothetical protein